MMPPKEQMDALRQQQKSRFQEPKDLPQEGEPVLRAEGFGPPSFNDASEDDTYPTFDNDDLERVYKDFEQEQDMDAELEQPYEDDAPEDDVTNENDRNFDTPPEWDGVGEHPVPPSLRQPGGRFLREETVFEGGPTRSEVSSWKKQFEQEGHGVYMTTHLDEVFIWRSLNREEYREIMSLQNVDPLQREEILCEVCVLFPYEYNFSSMASKKAGTPAVIAQQIMHESGFKKPAPPVRL